jgi:hypothetical protein
MLCTTLNVKAFLPFCLPKIHVGHVPHSLIPANLAEIMSGYINSLMQGLK